MPPDHDPLAPSRPPLSNAVLSAALGGLLSLTSCRSNELPPDAGTDGGVVHPADAGTTDASADVDGGSDGDAGSDVDAGVEIEDAGADAGADMDAGLGMDAGADAGALPDASLAPRDAACDVDPLRTITDASTVPGLTLEEFTAMCEGLGGYIEIHPHCGGMNSCGGISYDSDTGVLTEHTCAGLNTCTGFSCVIP
ncbi:MAG: hypothetical protein H6719_35875 [Sandaracinaceae bacterium]|nr:hypothetical protein [Sandaracinaceae bacterium]